MEWLAAALILSVLAGFLGTMEGTQRQMLQGGLHTGERVVGTDKSRDRLLDLGRGALALVYGCEWEMAASPYRKIHGGLLLTIVNNHYKPSIKHV